MRTNYDVLLSAASTLDASAVANVGGALTFRGRTLSFGALYDAAGIPGVTFRPLVADEDGDVDTGDNADFLAIIDGLWRDRMASTPYATSAQVATARALIGVGVIVCPTNAATIRNVDPAHSLALFEPPVLTRSADVRAAWDRLCGEFRDVVGTYLSGQVASAASKGRLLAVNTAIWDAASATSQVLHDAPAAVADAAASSVLGIIGGIAKSPAVLGLVALGIIGGVLWLRRGKIAAKVASA